MSFSKLSKTLLLCAGLVALSVLLVVMAFSSPKKEGEDGTQPLSSDEIADDPLKMNVLIAGCDRTSGLFDVMMLLSVDEASGRVCVLQIPRDTYASYTDGSYRKLNGAPRALGKDGFCAFLSDALGVSIDRYAALDLDAFGDIVDALGGVTLSLPDALHYDDPAQGLSIHLEAGEQTLDGAGAEQLVRYRSDYLRGDLGRLDAQKLFLAALFRRIKAVTASDVVRLSGAVLPAIDTDLTLPDLLSLYGLLPSISEDAVCFVTLPGQDCVGRQSGASYYVISAPSASEVMQRYFGARAEDFDIKKRFRHTTNEDFAAIYDTACAYSVYSAAQIGEDGIEISKTP